MLLKKFKQAQIITFEHGNIFKAKFGEHGLAQPEIKLVMKILVLLFSFLIGIVVFSQAQLCTGNLGDPIMNVTFGNVRAPLPENITSYKYTSECPNKGEYTLSTLIFGCGNHTWLLLAGDHTRDLHGNYMLVNAESTPGTIYTQTVTDLCSNTTYQLSAFIMNAMQVFSCDGKPVLPDVTLAVETIGGVTIASFLTGDVPFTNTGMWNLYALSFTLPENENAVRVRIKTNPKDGCGSAFAIDDITLKMCGPPITATIDGANVSSIDVCANYTNPFTLNATIAPGFKDPVVQWQNSIDTGQSWTDIPGETSANHQIPRRDSGMVLYRVLVAERANINSPNCRITSNAISTNVHPAPQHQMAANIFGCTGKELILPYSINLPQKSEWTGPNGYFSDQQISRLSNVNYADSGLYTHKQFLNNGCTTFDSFYLKVYPAATISAEPVYSVCEGTGVKLSATGGEKYKWIPADGLSYDTIANPVASPHDTTYYRVTISNAYGCRDSALVVVNVYRKLFADAGPGKTIIKGDSTILGATIKGTAVSFTWSPATFMNDSHLVNPTVFPQENMQYTLNAASGVGCGNASSSVIVKVYNDIYIPSAFTPNGDGKNDIFQIRVPDNYRLNKFMIYNRWGMLVYSNVKSGKGWDGTYKEVAQQTDTYVYYVELYNQAGKKITKKGTVTLLR